MDDVGEPLFLKHFEYVSGGYFRSRLPDANGDYKILHGKAAIYEALRMERVEDDKTLN
jgi:hypothetical protein